MGSTASRQKSMPETAQPDLFRLLVDRVQDYAIFALDPSGIVVSWNTGAQRIKGYAAEEIIGHHFSRFYPADAVRTGWPMTELENARRDGRFEDEGWRVRKDGSRFWANVVITALYDDDGELRGFAKVTRDMTESKRAERLEADAQQMSEFVAMLAHELRNPLAPIRNAVSLMQRRLHEPDRVRWGLEVIERQSAQLTRLVDDLLDVSRITRGTIRLERAPVPLADAVQHAIEAIRPACDEKKHVLEVQVHDAPVVRGDLVRLTQIVSNLLANACKYTPPGGRIEVSIDSDGDVGRVTVRDSGMGIAPELLPRVFDLFTQEARALDRAEGGLGLGLAIGLRLAQMHGGSLEAHSEGPGCGSAFVLSLPLAPSSETAGAGHRVLVVDDNRDAALTLQALFEVNGDDAVIAHDGETALRMARNLHPDVVLLDIGLPGMNGYEVARALRAIPGMQSVLLVAATGYGSENDRRRAMEAGFDMHVPKPVDYDALQRRIADWLQR